ncbi:MAG: putative bifunctional diguanylate cyclase/phosphodiesterase [Mycobacteriales bacterium]
MASDRQLSEVLSEFARTMLTNFPVEAILDRLTARIVDIMPVSAAGVSLISPGVGPRRIAASNSGAFGFEQLQTDLGEGPCLTAYLDGTAVSVPDLRDEDRFPRFTPRALAAGLAAVFSFPLRHEARRLGALDLYRDTPGSLNAEAMTAAQTLADVAAAYLINAQARAELQRASERSLEVALHDGLTGLPNRALMLERLQGAILRGRRSGLTSAVLFMDIDRFKAVNDVFGHSVGDALLVAVAKRLSEVLRPGDILARLSGDEFVVLCEDLTSTDQADQIVERLTSALSSPFALPGVDLEVTASVGVAFTGLAGHSALDVLHAADMAMYAAKKAGPGDHRFLDLRDQYLAEERASLVSGMAGLLDRNELHLDYQPIVAVADGRVTGVEALLRWQHPSRGLVSPSVIIPIAESLGLITAIGEWVLSQVLAGEPPWRDRFRLGRLAVSVNVSSVQLMAPGFTDSVAGLLARSSADPHLLTLEITESVFVRDAERALVVLRDLRDLGVKVALDNFGTGYSSLGYLLRFPVDIVKIDRTFVTGLGRERASESVVAAVIELAHDLGMAVVAEGVENAEQHRQLTRLGCDSCQGFYFARPMPAAGLETLIQRRGDGTERTVRTVASR